MLESYSSPPTDAACPELSPGLKGGYIAWGNKVKIVTLLYATLLHRNFASFLGNKVDISCAYPFSLPALLGIGISIGLLVIFVLLCCCFYCLRKKKQRQKSMLIRKESEDSDDLDFENWF